MQGLAEYSQAALPGFGEGEGNKRWVTTRHPDLLDLSTGALPNKTKGVNGTKSQQSLVCGCLRCRHQKDTNKKWLLQNP